MGFEDKAEQSVTRPYRQGNGRSKQTNELTSSNVPRGTSFHGLVELEFSPIVFCYLLPTALLPTALMPLRPSGSSGTRCHQPICGA